MGAMKTLPEALDMLLAMFCAGVHVGIEIEKP
jgi:hypothetical protein